MDRFASFDSTEIAYELVGPVAPATILLHHGFASTSRINWVRPGLADALVAAGHRMLLLDARGHGESDHPHDPSSYGGGAMARDVQALLDHLGVERVHMAGYSMGATVAMQVAARDSRIRSLFLGGVGPRQAAPEERGETLRRVVEALETDDASSVADPTALAFRNFAEATRQDRLALAAIQRAGGGADAATMSAILVPALVVNGSGDTLAGDPGAIAAMIPGARSIVVPGDHLSAVVKPEFRAALLEWAAS